MNEFLHGFTKYEWIFKENIPDDIKKFSKKNPTLQEYEDMLKKFTVYEEEIDKFVDSYKIGAMELKTANICTGLVTWCKDWKL